MSVSSNPSTGRQASASNSSETTVNRSLAAGGGLALACRLGSLEQVGRDLAGGGGRGVTARGGRHVLGRRRGRLLLGAAGGVLGFLGPPPLEAGPVRLGRE